MTYICSNFEVIKKHPLDLFCFSFALATMHTIVKRTGFGARQIRTKSASLIYYYAILLKLVKMLLSFFLVIFKRIND